MCWCQRRNVDSPLADRAVVAQILGALAAQRLTIAILDKIPAQIKKAQADALIAKQLSAVIKKIRDLMSKHGLTTAGIDAHVGRKRGPKPGANAAAKAPGTAEKKSAAGAKGKLPPKYRDPRPAPPGAVMPGRRPGLRTSRTARSF